MKNNLKQFLLHTAVYLPLCTIIILSMFFYIQKKTQKIHEYNQAQEVYFKKYTGNLKQHISIPLQEAGLSKEETGSIVKKLDSVLNMRRLAPRDKYLLTLDEQDNFKMLVVTKDFSRYYVAKEGEDLVVFPTFELDKNTKKYSWVYDLDDTANYYCLSNKQVAKYDGEECGNFEKIKMDKEWCQSYEKSTLIYKNKIEDYCKE